MSGPFRSIVPIIVTVVLLVGASVTVTLLVGPGEAQEFAPDSPEGVVQRFISAMEDRDLERAHEMLSESERERTSVEDLRSYSRFNLNDRDQRIRLDDVEIDGTRATVRITVERISGTGLDFNRWTYQRTIPLVLEDGDWKLDDAFAAIAFDRSLYGTG